MFLNKIKLQRCENCGTEYRYKTLSKTFWSGKPLICGNCGTEHILRNIYYTGISILCALPIFFSWMIRFSSNRLVGITIIFVYIITVVLLVPYLVKYDMNKN